LKTIMEIINSGDGAFRPVFTNGTIMTLDFARKILAKSRKLTRLRYEKWRAVLVDNQPVFVADVSRTSHNTVSINGQEFIYQIEENLRLGDHYPDYALSILTLNNLKPVVNYSLRSQIRHFLNNEETLTRTPA